MLLGDLTSGWFDWDYKTVSAPEISFEAKLLSTYKCISLFSMWMSQYNSIRRNLSRTCPIEVRSDVNTDWQLLVTNILTIYEQCVPTKRFTLFRRPWVNRVWKSWATSWSIYQNYPTHFNCNVFEQTSVFVERSLGATLLNNELAVVRDLNYAPNQRSVMPITKFSTPIGIVSGAEIGLVR